ncbi:MAG: hypothetical protein GY805_23825 [Chloroflexi bacterium]|nr:hypothetical protein [Chloroflexota bacterium]
MWLKGGNGRLQYRFAKAGRGGDKGEFAALLPPLVELFDEMGRGMRNGRNGGTNSFVCRSISAMWLL